MKVKKTDLAQIEEKHPLIWKRALAVAADRLDERNKEIGLANDIPRVFVISSSEAKPIVDEVTVCLDGKDIAVQTWNKGTFGVSDYPISSIMDAIEDSDFVIAVARADDVLVSRGKKSKVARDNVHLEYGISLGLLGRQRSLLLVCADDDTELPSDLAGLTTLRYRSQTGDEMKRSVRTACITAREHIEKIGVVERRRAR